MLTLQKTSDKCGISVDMTGTPIEQLLEKEWLLTNTRGASSHLPSSAVIPGAISAYFYSENGCNPLEFRKRAGI